MVAAAAAEAGVAVAAEATAVIVVGERSMVEKMGGGTAAVAGVARARDVEGCTILI